MAHMHLIGPLFPHAQGPRSWNSQCSPWKYYATNKKKSTVARLRQQRMHFKFTENIARYGRHLLRALELFLWLLVVAGRPHMSQLLSMIPIIYVLHNCTTTVQYAIRYSTSGAFQKRLLSNNRVSADAGRRVLGEYTDEPVSNTTVRFSCHGWGGKTVGRSNHRV